MEHVGVPPVQVKVSVSGLQRVCATTHQPHRSWQPSHAAWSHHGHFGRAAPRTRPFLLRPVWLRHRAASSADRAVGRCGQAGSATHSRRLRRHTAVAQPTRLPVPDVQPPHLTNPQHFSQSYCRFHSTHSQPRRLPRLAPWTWRWWRRCLPALPHQMPAPSAGPCRPQCRSRKRSPSSPQAPSWTRRQRTMWRRAAASRRCAGMAFYRACACCPPPACLRPLHALTCRKPHPHPPT